MSFTHHSLARSHARIINLGLKLKNTRARNNADLSPPLRLSVEKTGLLLLLLLSDGRQRKERGVNIVSCSQLCISQPRIVNTRASILDRLERLCIHDCAHLDVRCAGEVHYQMVHFLFIAQLRMKKTAAAATAAYAKADTHPHTMAQYVGATVPQSLHAALQVAAAASMERPRANHDSDHDGGAGGH